jgi:hypothetical protein
VEVLAADVVGPVWRSLVGCLDGPFRIVVGPDLCPLESVRIAVSDLLPVFRRGIMATLGDAGFDPEAPEDLAAWIPEEHRRVVLLTLESAEDWAS